jgi:hypothetical protein
MWSTLGNNLSGVVSLTLTHFMFANVSSFAQVLCAFPCLRELSIHHAVRFTPTAVLPSATMLRPPPDLHTLNLDIMPIGAVLEWFLSLSTRPTLRTVRLRHVQAEDFAVFQKFIGAFGNDLESLTLSTLIDDCKPLPYVILMMNPTMLINYHVRDSSFNRRNTPHAPALHSIHAR